MMSSPLSRPMSSGTTVSAHAGAASSGRPQTLRGTMYDRLCGRLHETSYGSRGHWHRVGWVTRSLHWRRPPSTSYSSRHERKEPTMISQPAMPGRARTTPEAAGERFDVIVVGAGPAGAICAHNLGARGYSVLLVDREDRGRFHIGESLIPYVVELWAQEGIGDDVAAGPFIHKPGVQIDDRQVDRTFVFDFTQPQPNRRNYAYNVERAELDGLLTDLAAGTGVRVVQNA